MNGLREFFNSPSGKATAIGLVLVAVVLAFWSFRQNFGGGEGAAIARDRMYIDAATGKPFEHTLKVGDVMPLKAPSGGNTGWPAELCYWTKDGKAKTDPTFVLLNQYVHKSGPTFCPDCGRVVRMHNPAPAPGVRPPPTKDEMDKRQQDRQWSDPGDGR
ncbi:MAG: hypothetical protein ACJ786_39610 [Catenulispora sp.]